MPQERVAPQVERQEPQRAELLEPRQAGLQEREPPERVALQVWELQQASPPERVAPQERVGPQV